MAVAIPSPEHRLKVVKELESHLLIDVPDQMTVVIEFTIQIMTTAVLQPRDLEQELDVLGEQVNHASSKRVVAARESGDRTVCAVVRSHKAGRYIDLARKQAEARCNRRGGFRVNTHADNRIRWVEQVLIGARRRSVAVCEIHSQRVLADSALNLCIDDPQHGVDPGAIKQRARCRIKGSRARSTEVLEADRGIPTPDRHEIHRPEVIRARRLTRLNTIARRIVRTNASRSKG